MAKLVSKVYGDALFSLALEEDRLDEIWDEVKGLQTALEENKEFMEIMAHPEMTQEKSRDLVESAFQGKLSETMMGFLQILVKKGRFGEILPCWIIFRVRQRNIKRLGLSM